MKIVNGKVFIGHRFVQGGVEFDRLIENFGETVTGKDGFDAEGGYIIPGLVDIHTHGAMGADASDASQEGLKRMACYYAANGVTGWLPTTMTIPEPELVKALESIRDFTRPTNGAKVFGVHLEGPFISPGKCGAQNPEDIRKPDVDSFHRWNEAAGGRIKLITVAPEAEGGLEYIREISKTCRVSVGHTAAGYEIAREAFEAGATHTTHLYNGMTPFSHREPGVPGAAFDAGVTAELIADGLHVAPAVVRMTAQLFGDRLVLVSDSGRCAGMPDGEYALGGQSITMTGGKACLSGTDTLACSSVSLLECVRRAASFGIPLEDAVYAASAAPARAIGAEKVGSIEVGYSADLVVLDESLQVKAVFVDGARVEA